MATKRKRKREVSSVNVDREESGMRAPPKKRRKRGDHSNTTQSIKSSNKNVNTSAPAINEQKEKEAISSDVVFILAHGAGTNSAHPNMINWKRRLSDLGTVIQFDFKRPYNKIERSIATYQSCIDSTIRQYPTSKLVLIGTSMGSRVSIHLANTNGLPSNCAHIIALGYPLYVKKSGNIREQPLLEFVNSDDAQLNNTRLLLISGTKDTMAPSNIMNAFYEKVKGKHVGKVGNVNKCQLHWIDGANHSLKVGKRHELGQDAIDQSVIDIKV